MDGWQAIAPQMTPGEGQMMEATVAGIRMLLARVNGQYYAAQALCPHLRGRLARGRLEGHIVICPAHGSRFDIRDGRNLDWIPRLPALARRVAQAVSNPTDLTVYSTRIENGQLWIKVP
jgi:nitrite reductase/ring-hydroxylating ferredoxin subunit